MSLLRKQGIQHQVGFDPLCIKFNYKSFLNVGPSAPSLVRVLCSCSIVVWRAPDRAYGSITGYDVNFVPFGLNNVTISKGYQDLFHVISDDEVPMNIRGNTKVQVLCELAKLGDTSSKFV